MTDTIPKFKRYGIQYGGFILQSDDREALHRWGAEHLPSTSPFGRLWEVATIDPYWTEALIEDGYELYTLGENEPPANRY